jgi:2-amino-4-hydroxy-6-hydroxymethyldihydropteridine diphosphokinase
MIGLGLGSNIEDGNTTREQNIICALKLLAGHEKIKVEKISPLYLSEPVGFRDQADFLNCAAIITTSLAPHALLEECLAIEKEMKRERKIRWGPRNIDIDLLFYRDVVLDEENLKLPHPQMPNRKFVLLPLRDIAADFPAYYGLSPAQMLEVTLDQSAIEKYYSPTFADFLRFFAAKRKCGE